MAAKMERTATPGIYKRGSRYVVVWTFRGKQHKQSFRTLVEAREAKGQRQAGDRRPVSQIRFGEYFEQWIESYAGRTARGFSETTRPEYRRPIVVHAMPTWETWKLGDIQPADVRDRFGKMRKDGATTSQIKKLRAALSALFATAVEDGLIRSNPVQGVRVPASNSSEPDDPRPKALTRAELGLLLAATPNGWQRLLLEFLAVTGLRISEAVGLRWRHLDLGEDPHVRVREQFYRGERRKLKSSAGRRDVPLSRDMTARLLAHRRDHYRGEDTPVFASKAGTELNPSNLQRRVLGPAAVAIGFYVEVERDDGEPYKRPTVGFHTLRHTCASMLFDVGRNVKQVAEWLGHSDPGFTLRTYVHLIDAGVGEGLTLDSGNGVATDRPGTAANDTAAEAAAPAD